MNTKRVIYYSTLFVLVMIFGACEKDTTEVVENPDYSYDGSNYTANAAVEIGVRTALADLTSEMKKGRAAGTVVDFAALSQLYQNGNPSLAAITSDYYRSRIEGPNGWLAELAKASGGTYTPGTPQGDGGAYAGYLFEENGLELEQMVEKGLFAAAMYRHAVNVLDGNLDAATTDRVVAIFGANPDFSNSDSNAMDNPDAFSAKYAARRDKNDGNGFYTQMQEAFAKLQTSIAGGDDRQREQQEAIDAIKTIWEKALFATVINYCHTAIAKLSATNPSDEDKASALHAYGEAVGFAHGWRGLPQSQKLITDAQIDELLELLNAPQDGTPTSYTFVTDPVNQLPKLTQVIEKVQNIYGFSAQQIEDFKENWVSRQGR